MSDDLDELRAINEKLKREVTTLSLRVTELQNPPHRTVCKNGALHIWRTDTFRNEAGKTELRTCVVCGPRGDKKNSSDELRAVIAMAFEREMPTVYHNTILPLVSAAFSEEYAAGRTSGALERARQCNAYDCFGSEHCGDWLQGNDPGDEK